jgi:exodeoxyribonuclease VII small subunit
MPRSASPKPVEELNYEAAFSELESIVDSLENEQRPLEESMALYERGQALVKRCSELLEKAELKVRQLSGNDLTEITEE